MANNPHFFVLTSLPLNFRHRGLFLQLNTHTHKVVDSFGRRIGPSRRHFLLYNNHILKAHFFSTFKWHTTKLWCNNVAVFTPRSPTNIDPHSQRIVRTGILKYQAEQRVAAEWYVVFMTFKISRIHSRWRVCLYFLCINSQAHTSKITNNVSVHLVSQCQCISTVTMSVYIYCHNVSVHLLSQCQCTSTVTMSVYIYCHSVSVYVVSQFLLSVHMSITLLLITILNSRYLSTKQRHQYVFTIKKSTDESWWHFNGTWICSVAKWWWRPYVHHCHIHTCW